MMMNKKLLVVFSYRTLFLPNTHKFVQFRYRSTFVLYIHIYAIGFRGEICDKFP